MSQPAYDSSYGSVADEAARLIGLFKGLSEAEAQAAGERVAAGGDRASATAGGGAKGGFGAPAAKSVSPETIERLADVVDMIGDGLRGFAESRRAAKTR